MTIAPEKLEYWHHLAEKADRGSTTATFLGGCGAVPALIAEVERQAAEIAILMNDPCTLAYCQKQDGAAAIAERDKRIAELERAFLQRQNHFPRVSVRQVIT